VFVIVGRVIAKKKRRGSLVGGGGLRGPNLGQGRVGGRECGVVDEGRFHSDSSNSVQFNSIQLQLVFGVSEKEWLKLVILFV